MCTVCRNSDEKDCALPCSNVGNCGLLACPQYSLAIDCTYQIMHRLKCNLLQLQITDNMGSFVVGFFGMVLWCRVHATYNGKSRVEGHAVRT